MPITTALQYEFHSPPRVVFGWGGRAELGTLARTLGCRAFVISGSRTLAESGELERLEGLLRRAGVLAVSGPTISREPEVADVDHAVAFLREHRADPGMDLVVAIGGGSAIDLGKAAAALAPDERAATVLDYLEGVGKGLKIESPTLPVLAVPTTSGTGSEATRNSVISADSPPGDRVRKARPPLFKKSLRSERMIPRAVLIDPELTVSVPPQITAWTGMDAITQLLESYLSKRAQPIPQALALHGLELAFPALREAVMDGESRPARERMAHAAYLSGLALANSGLGLAHGVAAALGVHCRVPHGQACAVMLPTALRVNRGVRQAELARIAEVITGRTWGSEAAAADAAVEAVEQLCHDLQIPRRLSELGVRREQIPDLVQGSHGNSLDGNPREVPDAELRDILESLL